MFKLLKLEQIAKMLGVLPEEVSSECRELIKDNFPYRRLTQGERDRVLLKVIKKLESGTLSVSGEHRRSSWERGWSENLEELKKNKDNPTALVPKYIRPNQIIRLLGDYMMPGNDKFELNWYKLFRTFFFKKYLSGTSSIYEFGCGSGYNFPILAEVCPNAEIAWSRLGRIIIGDNINLESKP